MTRGAAFLSDEVVIISKVVCCKPVEPQVFTRPGSLEVARLLGISTDHATV